MLRSRMTPVVVSSVPPMMFAIFAGCLVRSVGDEIAAVVHGELWIGGDGRFDVAVIARVVLAFDREHAHPVVDHERGGDVILRRERVARAQRDLGPAGLERQHEIRGLGSDVQTRANAHACKGLLFGKALADGREHGHALGRPRHASPAFRREPGVFDVARASGRLELRRRQAFGTSSEGEDEAASFWVYGAEILARGLRPRLMEWALVTLSTLGIDAYARALASAAPTPGGGSASAVVGVLAASLASMVAHLTGDSPKFAPLAPRMKALADEAARLSDAFLSAIDADVAAFDRVSAAYKLPKSTDAERAARSAAIQGALVGATDAPMRVVELGLQTSRLAMELVDAGNPNAISDAGCAALFAQAAARGAALNIRINVKGLKDTALAASYQRKLDDLLAQIGILTEVAIVKAERATERTP